MTDEYLELCGEWSVDHYQPTDYTECLHNNIEQFEDGSGYCVDCAMSFTNIDNIQTTCDHKNIYHDQNHLYICRDCNCEVQIDSDEPEWKYYDSGKDPARCHRVRGVKRTVADIFRLNNIEIPLSMQETVDSMYNKIVGSNTVRGKRRKKLTAACYYHAMIEFGQPRPRDYIRNMFGDMTKSDMSAGLDEYYDRFPEARSIFLEPIQFVPWLFQTIGLDESYKKSVEELVSLAYKTIPLMKTVYSHIAAAGILYYYLCHKDNLKNNLGVTKNIFCSKFCIAEIALKNVIEEIDRSAETKTDI